MKNEIYFALYAIKKNIQSSAELRTSFLMNIVGMMINNSSFLIIWLFFVESVGIINGWTSADIIGLLGYVSICFGIVFSAGGGISKLADYVASGSFDRIMLSPKNALIRVATSSFSVSAIGDIVFGILCLIIYGYLIHANIYQIILILLFIVFTSIVFLSAAIIAYSASFLFPDAKSVTRSLFEVFNTPSLFHGGAFQGAVRFIFTFIIPSLLIGALPVEIVRNFSIDKFILVIVLTLFWFLLSIRLFNLGVRKYESSNFMTFGN